MPDLKEELRRLADEAARQARPLAVADVIREGERRHRRAFITRRRPSAPASGLVTGTRPGRRPPGWVAPLASAAAVMAVIAAVVTVSGALHDRRPAGPAAATVYVIYERSCTPMILSHISGTVPNHRTGSIIPISTAADVPGLPIRLRGLVGGLAATPDGRTLYAVTGNSVIPISTATNTPGRPISIGRAWGAGQIAITPDGKTAYVLSPGSGRYSTVTPISTATNTPGRPINIGPVSGAGQIAITPDGKTAYVLSPGSGSHSTIIPISTATNRPGKPIRVGINAQAIVFTPDGNTAYVSNGGWVRPGRDLSLINEFVTPINTATNTAGHPIQVGYGASTLAITPDGKTLYAGGPDAVTPISTATSTPGKPIPVGTSIGLPFTGPAMAITPDGKTLYVLPTVLDRTRITPISIATNTPGKSIDVTGPCPSFAVTPDGKTLYVANKGKVIPISTATNVPGHPIRLPAGLGYPAAIDISPASP